MSIKVKVKGDDLTKVVGYYDHQRRRSGETFEIADDAAFAPEWMEKVDGPAVPHASIDKLAPYKPNVGEKKPLDPTLLHVPQPADRKTTRDAR